jgi:hypothetical protein
VGVLGVIKNSVGVLGERFHKRVGGARFSILQTEDKPLTNTTLFGTLADAMPYPIGFPVGVLVLSLSYADDNNVPIPIAINADRQLYIYKRTGMSILGGKHYRASLTYFGIQV